MVNKKDLRAGVASMRKTAAFLQQWADDLEASLIAQGGRKVAVDAEPVPVVEEESVVSEASDVAAPELTLEFMREYLGTKSAAGYKTQVNALICSYGVSKLSEVDPAHYADLFAAAERLGGDPDAG